MAFGPDSWSVRGGATSDVLARILADALANGQQGVVNIADLQVKALATPGGAVLVGSGAAIVIGQEVEWQGGYAGYNDADIQVTIAANTSGATRYDLVYLRVEDPTFSGSPWDHDVTTDPIFYPVVKQGVSAGTRSIPSGESGIPLALLTIPTGTSAITSDMIDTSIRKKLNPLTHLEQFSLQGIWDPGTDNVGNTTTDYEQFPSGASWSVDVPNWAAQAVISWTFGGLQYVLEGGDSGGSTTEARGKMRVLLGSTPTVDTGYWVRGVPSGSRVTYTGGDTLNIPASMRGTTQTLQMQGIGTAGYKYALQADGWAGLVLSIMFRQIPVTGTPDRSPS